MSILFKIVNWYAIAGLAYALWTIASFECVQFVFETRLFGESFISDIDEERKSEEKMTYTEAVEMLSTFGAMEYARLIGYCVLLWPTMLIKNELKCLMDLFKLTR